MLLIDAFNVLHLPQAVVAGRSLVVADLAGLIGTSRYAGESAVLVCDGSGDGSVPAPPGKRGRARVSGVEVVFSGPGGSADDEIEARLRRGGGHGMTVVSDDRRLRRAASRVRAKRLGSGVFLAHLLKPGGQTGKRPVPAFVRDIPLDRYAVAHWMEAFGLTPGDLLARGGSAASGGQDRERGEGRSKPRSEGKPDSGGFTVRYGSGANARKGALPAEPVLPDQDLEDDPVIRAALEEWGGRLRVEDLDMARWLEDRGRAQKRPDG